MAGLVPAISIPRAQCLPKRDGRHAPAMTESRSVIPGRGWKPRTRKSHTPESVIMDSGSRATRASGMTARYLTPA